jgi:hypothetical protein
MTFELHIMNACINIERYQIGGEEEEEEEDMMIMSE